MSSFVFQTPVMTPSGAATLVSITVSPNPAWVKIGSVRPFTAIGNYSDGSAADLTLTVVWASSAPAIALIGAGTGVASGVAPGSVTITATSGAIVGSAALTVVAASSAVGNYQLVAAIEGWPYLMTDGAPEAAIAAWDGTDWQQALGGMVLEGMIEQTIDPYDPSPSGGEGGTLYLSFVPDEDDILGIATHRTDAGAEAFLTSTIDVDDTTIPLANTVAFPAAPGELCIGTETIAYSAKGATSVTASKRGMYAPFSRNAADNFGRHHRLATYGFLGPQLKPIATEHHRVWIGRQVGVWEHRKTNGVLNPYDEAIRVFAGIIVGVRDVKGMTVLTLQSMRDTINDTVVMRDQFSGQIREGVLLEVGNDFNAQDTKEGAGPPTTLTANPLVVLPSGSSGANQVDEDWYTLVDLYSIINRWLESERIAGRLHGTYSFALSTTVDGESTGEAGYRTKLDVYIPTGASGYHGHFAFSGPTTRSWQFMGYEVGGGSSSGDLEGEVPGDTNESIMSENAPVRWTLTQTAVDASPEIEFESIEGLWQSQAKKLPTEPRNLAIGSDPTLAGEWGLLLFNNNVVFLAQRDLGSDPTGKTFTGLLAMSTLGDPFSGTEVRTFVRRYGEEPIRLTQIFILEDTFAALTTSMLVSTGTLGYNDSTGGDFDVLPYGVGLAIPERLLHGGSAEEFYNRLLALPSGAEPMRLKIEKPIRFADLVSGDFLIRVAHLVWKIGVPGSTYEEGVIRIAHWVTATIATATVNLTEANKAAPADTEDDQRSVSDLSGKWARNVAKFEFARTFDGRYTDRITVIDPVSVDANGASAITIPSRNMDRSTIEGALPNFVTWFPTVSRPLRVVRRTGDLSLFYTANVLDTCVITDDEVRDSTTGRRGCSRPGIILRHAISLGGWVPGTDEVVPPLCEMDIVLMPVDRVAPWSPAAQVDETVSGGGFSGGYNSATKTLRLKNHAYSEATEATDPSYFAANHAIEVIQIDPDNPGSPLYWTAVIASRTSTDITLVSALAAPAWDATKFYYIRPRSYGSVLATQRATSYEADDFDGLIENLRSPYDYAAVLNSPSQIIGHTEAPERYATVADSDGAALDVANEFGAAKLINNLVDHRTAVNSPAMDNVVRPGSGGAARALVFLRRVHFNPQRLTGGLDREIEIRPWFRSKTGGSTTIRITLARHKPLETPGEATCENVTFTGIHVNFDWTTTSTASWTTAAATSVPTSPIDDDGNVWLAVEISGDGEARGAPLVRMKERT